MKVRNYNSKKLYEAGIKTKRGNLNWSNNDLKVLRNEKYISDLCRKKLLLQIF